MNYNFETVTSSRRDCPLFGKRLRGVCTSPSVQKPFRRAAGRLRTRACQRGSLLGIPLSAFLNRPPPPPCAVANAIRTGRVNAEGPSGQHV